jgi:hypothetical protein
MFAQSLVEYGSLSSIATRAESLAYSVRSWFGSLSPTTWVVVAIVGLGLFFWKRR